MDVSIHPKNRKGTWQFAACGPGNELVWITAGELRRILAEDAKTPSEAADRALTTPTRDRMLRGGLNR